MSGAREAVAAARAVRAERDARLEHLDFDRAPFTVAWEVTRACAYRCLHCRADAQPRRHPLELTTGEGVALIGGLETFGTRPILVLTGGDPLMRRDLFELARFADRRGLRVSLTPTATALTTRERMREAREAGVRRVAFSVDAADPAVHDRFRGFEGSFTRTLRGMENAAAEGLPLQINTTACRLNVDELERMVPLLERWRVVQWSVFFLVPVGRGRALPMLSAHEHERVLGWLYDVSREAPFDVKTTAAPQYRRIVAQRARSEARAAGEGVRPDAGAGAGFRFADGLDRPAKGVNDGRGFMFISHSGEVMPSGFLPIPAGSVRRRSPVDIYRRSSLFRQLRDPGALTGKCGRCEFRELCGGSRARAYAVTGDPLAADPSCPYEPAR
ncbi:MAG: TIGR04053 family radical SAM/SPASM domain-containing protein [Solirubrobacterales bacterium]|nr:TIGR04053 family radical SAM/SPASM domain-containing protein [Solirubrobacterales bacterium]